MTIPTAGLHAFTGTTSSPNDRVYRHGRDSAGRKSRCRGGFADSRGGLALIRSMGSSGGARGRRGDRHRDRELLKHRPGGGWNASDPGSQLPWLGENDDAALVEACWSVPSALSPQSMLLTADQNNIMRLPNYSCFMHHQENLQALLVDIHADPQGFKEFVEAGRNTLAEHLGDAVVAAASAGTESLADYTNLSEVAQGRFSVVFYAESKRTRRPCAMKRIELVHLDTSTANQNGGNNSPANSSSSSSPGRQPRPRRQRRAAARAPSPEQSPPPLAGQGPAVLSLSSVEGSGGGGETLQPGGGSAATSPATTGTDGTSASMVPWGGSGDELLLSRKSDGGGGGGGGPVKEEGDEREGGGGRGKKNGGGRKNARKAMTFEHCLKEVGLLKNLASPNIVQLHTWFLDGNALWVVMDWVDGGDLKGMLERTKKAGNRLSELTIWRLFAQVCDALFHMHGERIMHRDLKPANVLLCRDGTVKLGDLGLGRYLNVHSVMAMSRVGTPLYMSPETLKGRGHGMVSDIWSLGCILYELTMLASPFEGKHPTLKTLFSKIVRADYPPVDGTLYNEHFGNLVAHLLIPDPNLRPKITVVQPAAHLALLRAEQDAVEYLHAEQLAAAVDAKCGGFY